jgi:hypothetical protein
MSHSSIRHFLCFSQYPQRMLFRYDEELVVVITCLAMYAVVIFFLSIYFQAANGSKSNFITKWAFGAGP